MAKRGENIYKRKDGRYEGRFIRGRKPDGKISWGYVYGNEYKDVKQRLEKKKTDALNAGLQLLPKCAFEEWINHWLEVLSKPYIKPSTYSGYRRIADKHLIPFFGKLTLREITPADCQIFVDELCGNLSVSTAKGICRMLKSALEDAVKYQWLSVNPYIGVKEPKAEKTRPRVLTKREQQQIERAALNNGQLEYLVFLYTGIRLGEMCALRWKNIDFIENTVSVEATAQRVATPSSSGKTTVHFGTPKSNAGTRTVPMQPFLAALLMEKHRKEQRGPNEFVFYTKDGKYLDTRTVQSRFSRMAESLGIEGAHIHTLRHTYAARCRENGIGFEVIAELMGHSSPSVTIQFYGGCTTEQKVECVQKLNLIA